MMKVRIIRPAGCMHLHTLQRKRFGIWWTVFDGDLKECERAMAALIATGSPDTIVREHP